MVTWSGSTRFTVLAISLGGFLLLVGKVMPSDCPVFRQTTEVQGPGYSFSYEVEAERISKEEMRIHFTLTNDSSASVLLLWQRDFFVSIQKRCLTVRMGSTVGHEGNDIPRLEPIAKKPFNYEEVRKIPRSDEEVTCLEFVFFYLVDSDSDLARLLYNLETDGSNWFTLGDLDLTERYYNNLQTVRVRFPVEAGNLGCG